LDSSESAAAFTHHGRSVRSWDISRLRAAHFPRRGTVALAPVEMRVSSTGDAASLAALERAGEKFMSMFDDDPPRAKKRKNASASTGTSDVPTREKSALKAGNVRRTRKRHESSGDDETDTASIDEASKFEGLGRGGVASKRTAAAAASCSPGKEATPRDPQVVVFSGDRPNRAASQAAAASALVGDGMHRAKRLFMSDSITRVHEVARSADPSATEKRGGAGGIVEGDSPAGEVTGLTGASLNDMRKRVQAFGAAGLDKWSRKALEQKTRVSLGAKAEKGVRTPPSIGVGMWKKNEEREESRRAEAFEAGGKLEKKKRGLRKADRGDTFDKGGGRDRGLAWGSGQFKGGVLTISKRELAKEGENAGGSAYLAGTKLAGSDPKRRPGRKKKGSAGGGKKKGGRPQGGKKGKKR